MVQKVAPAARRAYSSEMANALVQVSQNIGMGNAAIGLGGAGVSTLSHTYHAGVFLELNLFLPSHPN